jgi:hypothetical protein
MGLSEQLAHSSTKHLHGGLAGVQDSLQHQAEKPVTLFQINLQGCRCVWKPTRISKANETVAMPRVRNASLSLVAQV